MNSSRYLVLIVAVFLVVSAEQSENKNPSSQRSKKACETIKIIDQSSKENEDSSIYLPATRLLRDLFLNGTNYISESEETLRNGIESARKLIRENPKAAQKVFQQALANARDLVFRSGTPFFKSYGAALSLSNYTARPGLEMASRLVQEAGFSILDSVDAVEILFNKGITGRAYAGEDLLETILLAIEIGYTGAFNNIQQSIRVADQALRDAQNKPQEQVKQQDCGRSVNDTEGSNAIRDINESADQALKRGANADQVKRLRQAFICAIKVLVNITADGQRTVENLKPIADSKPSAAEMTFFNRSEVIKTEIHKMAAKLYVIVGEIAQKAGKLNNNEIGEAINAIEKGKVIIFSGTKIAGDFIVIGLSYEGEAPELGIEAAGKTGDFAKKAFIQGIVQGFKFTLTVL